MHPNYRAMAGGGPYAHPYACSEYLFSDESAALYRAELGLPPLEPYYPLRPSVVLTGKSGGIVGYEHEVAEQVALLQSKGELPPRVTSASITSVEAEDGPIPTAPSSSKRLRVQGVDPPSEGSLVLAKRRKISHSPSGRSTIYDDSGVIIKEEA